MLREKTTIIRTGWIMDLYPDTQKPGIVIWLIDQEGERLQLFQPFPITFYATGTSFMLREAWKFLRTLPYKINLLRTERKDVFQNIPITVLAVEVENPADQPALFRELSNQFPDLDYFNADLTLFIRHAGKYHTFPFCHCTVTCDEQNNILDIQVHNTPWEIAVTRPPFRTLTIEPDVPPKHQQPTALILHQNGQKRILKLSPTKVMLITLNSILKQYDPDLLLTAWGDGWMMPYLLEQSEKCKISLQLNRDENQKALRKNDLVYFSYGQTIYRDQQIHLYGRLHIDIHNATLFHDYGVDGILELGKVTSLPIQTVARVSPGSGISAMQMVRALQDGILVPWHKQQAENTKTALDLIRVDSGGLIFQPTIGVHEHVASIDFISMYPSIMVYHNISPETISSAPGSKDFVENPRDKPKGLIPNTLDPLLQKRIVLRRRLAEMPKWDPAYKSYKAQSSAHKWLLVTCFGYLGYRNARFGRIEAHEAVTAYGREALMRAKELAEENGYEILHMYVDSLFLRSEQPITQERLNPLLALIEKETGLPISTDGIFRWLVFLPSKANPKVPVPNRYFGAFEDGSLKMRGIETRRRDTPLWIAEIQQTILEEMAVLPSIDKFTQLQPKIIQFLQYQLKQLKNNQIPLEKLLVSQKLSRELEDYRSPSPAARAAAQMVENGQSIRPGQMIKFLYLQNRKILAWNMHFDPEKKIELDIQLYIKLLFRAISTILEPFGLDEIRLRRLVLMNIDNPETKVRQNPLFKQYTLLRTNSMVSRIHIPQEKITRTLPNQIIRKK